MGVDIGDLCRNLMATDKKLRRNAAAALASLGPGIVAKLESIIVSEDAKSEANWPLLIGAVSTLNNYCLSRKSKVRKYQEDLKWLPQEHGRCDMHIHTELSDGTDSVAQVVQKAVQSCTKTLALCDHNTMDGVKIACELGNRVGIEVVPSCELPAHVNLGTKRSPEWFEVHMAGYFLNPDCERTQKLLMSMQRRVILLDMLIAHEILKENATELHKILGHSPDVLDVLLEANTLYAERLRTNDAERKAHVIVETIEKINAARGYYRTGIESLMQNTIQSSISHEYTNDEYQLINDTVLFSGFMLAEPMNKYCRLLADVKGQTGDWFSEIRKREAHFLSRVPKIDPYSLAQAVSELGGIPLLSHPTWYIVKLIRLYRNEFIGLCNRQPSKTEESVFKERALEKGLSIIHKMHRCMPKGLQVMDLYHWSYDAEMDLEPILRNLAGELGLFLLTGSDYHGLEFIEDYPSMIGTGATFNICGTYAQVRALKSLR